MAATSTRRVQKELKDVMAASELLALSVAPDEENLLKWDVEMAGPSSSPYKGGKFKLSVEFANDYPFKAPTIKFQTRVYHPNVDDEGNICVALLKTEVWKPATKMTTVLLNIYNLLIEPNPDDPLVASIADVYRQDRKKYDATAKDWVKKYASA